MWHLPLKTSKFELYVAAVLLQFLTPTKQHWVTLIHDRDERKTHKLDLNFYIRSFVAKM